jgi:uncharacterized protein YecE (DUF72 family)
VPEKGLTEMPGAAALVPAAMRSKWERPRPPAETDTTLARLEKRTRKDLIAAARPEMEKLAKKVAATAESIRDQLPKL